MNFLHTRACAGRLLYVCFIIAFTNSAYLYAQAEWTQQQSGVTSDLWGAHFVDDSEGYAVGSPGVILKTADGGATWDEISNPNLGLLAVHFATREVGYAVGFFNENARIIKTENAGDSWVQQDAAGSLALTEVFTLNSEEAYAVGFGGSVVKTLDGGAVWTLVSPIEAQDDELWAAHFSDAENGIVGGGTGFNGGTGAIYKTEDGGASWVQAYSGTQRVNSFAAPDDMTIYAACDGGLLLRSIDGGDTWLELGNSGFTSRINSIVFSDAQNGWFVTAGGFVFRTVNGGDSWEQQNSPVQGATFIEHVVFPTPQAGYAVGGGGTILAFKDPAASVRPPSAWEAQYDVTLYPNPFVETFSLSYNLPTANEVAIAVYSNDGRLVERRSYPREQAGRFVRNFSLPEIERAAQALLVEITIGERRLTRKIVMK